MKPIFYFSLQRSLALLSFLICSLWSSAQVPGTVFSRFDFNQTPLVQATIGPNGIYINPDAATDGIGAYISDNCGSPVGIDLVIGNPGSVFDVPSLGMRFRFLKSENFANFFNRGNTSFYIQAGMLYIEFTVLNGLGIPTTIGPIPTGYFPPNDNQFHVYEFVYQEWDGTGRVFVDNGLVYTYDGPDGSPLFWSTGADVVVGTIMDGSCAVSSILDFAEFYIPNNPLPVEFVDFTAKQTENRIDLNWITQNEINNSGFKVLRAGADGLQSEIAFVDPGTADQTGLFKYSFNDSPPENGTYFYQIEQTDLDGQSTKSKVLSTFFETMVAAPPVLFPNPSRGKIRLDYAGDVSQVRVYDRFGVVVSTPTPSALQNGIDLSGLPMGIYFFELTTENGTEHLRVIIE